MSRHLECVFIHVVFGVLLFVMGIVDLLLNFGDFFIGVRSFVIFCGAWMYITGGFLAINRKRTSCRRKGLADQILSPANVPAGDVQMVPTCMPPRSAFQNNDRPPPYGAGSPGPDLLLVPLEGTSVVQQNDRPPPYTVDAQTCSHGSDLLLVPLEMTPMPPQETGPPPPYHQISTTESVISSFHDGHQPPPYVCTDEQMWITGGILAINCKNTSCIRKALTGLFITSSLCGVAVGVSYIVLLVGMGLCEYPCEPQTTVPTIVCILGFLPCIAGCSGCYCVASSSRQADRILSPPNVPGGNAQMVPTCMPLHSVVQQNDLPPPYTVDAQTCSQGSDLLLVPLETTPMPPQETGPPPPYHQISTTESVMSSLHDGHQPPPYVCTDEQHRVTTYV